MSDRRRIDEKAEALQRRHEEESLMLRKKGEEYEVMEEVFDRPTLEAVYRLIQKKVIDKIQGVVKAGKEARIYYGLGPGGEELALKIYYTSSADFRKGMLKYIRGDPRFKRIGTNPRTIIYTWAQKEYKNLQLAEEAEVNAPRPIEVYRNVLVMTFIGVDGVPAPLLREVDPEDPEGFYRMLLGEIRKLYTGARLVHGDMSEYNVMVWDEMPVIFDVSQAMLTVHPLAESLIERDVENVNSYFGKLGVEVVDPYRVLEWVKGGAEDLP